VNITFNWFVDDDVQICASL